MIIQFLYNIKCIKIIIIIHNLGIVFVLFIDIGYSETQYMLVDHYYGKYFLLYIYIYR